MMKTRVLLVGCGEHASENLIPSLIAINSVEVAGLCDNDSQAVERAARWFPDAARIHSERLTTENISAYEALVVAATPQVHEHVARLAIDLGKPVFVEKPPAVFTSELQELAGLARARRLITCVGHNLRHSDAAIQFRKAIAMPGFGRPVAMEMRYLASKPRGTRWGLASPLRSFLLSHANHAIDLMIYQMGDIRQVVAARAYPDVDGGIAITAQFIFESGAVGNLLATSYAPHFTLSATVISDVGCVALMNGLHDVQVHDRHTMGKRWGSSWKPRTLETGFRFAGYQTELERFFIAIANNTPEGVHPSFENEVAIYKAMDSIEESIERS
jgi:phthalate 4,5-cis-dihydrodiol dehydrogenase